MVLVFRNSQINSLEDLQKLKAKDLRDLLKSKGENYGGNKADLVLKAYALLMRDVSCSGDIRGGNDLSGFTPDPGAFSYGSVLQQISPLGWSSDLRQLPALSFIQLYDYLVVSTRKYKHIVLKGTNYKKLKAYQFFYEGHIKALESKGHQNKKYVKAAVLASMKKKKYNVVIEFSDSSDILRAACTCPAGLGARGQGKCNHTGGVLFAMEDFCRRGLKSHPEPLSCTSRLSVWVVPRNQSVTAKPLDKILIRKIRFGKEKIRDTPKLINFDPRASYQRQVNKKDFQKLCDSLQDCIPLSMFHLFYDNRPNAATQGLRGNQNEMPSASNIENVQNESPVAFSDSYDIASPSFKELVDKYVQNMKITEIEVEATEKQTRGQHNNKLWKEKRKLLLTASNFGKAAKTKVEPSKKIKSMLYTDFVTESVLYGRENEANAVKLYREQALATGKFLQVEEPGLMISQTKPFLGATLDRIITDTRTGEKWGLEVKCPISKAGMTAVDASKNKTFFLRQLENSQIQLKHNHDYFYQIQGQLFVSGLQSVDLVVYFGNDKPIYVENIVFNKTLWYSEILPKLEFFYKRATLPEIFTERVKRKKKLYIHGGWMSFKDSVVVHRQ